MLAIMAHPVIMGAVMEVEAVVVLVRVVSQAVMVGMVEVLAEAEVGLGLALAQE